MLILKKKLSLNRHRYTNKKRDLKFSPISPNKVVIKSKVGHLLSPQQREVYKSILSKLVRGEYKTLSSNLKRPLQTDIGKGIVVALTQTFELKTKRVSKHDSRVIFLLKTVCFLDSYGELNKIIKIRNMKQTIFLGINKFLQRSYLMGTLNLLFGINKFLQRSYLMGTLNLLFGYIGTQHIITKNHRDFSLYNTFGGFAEPKNLTLSTHDANIDYFSDFKIMRFGVVGVKVWFQVKKRKPYFYRFSFLLLSVATIILFLVQANRNRNFGTLQISRPKTVCLIMKRPMFRASELFLTRAAEKVEKKGASFFALWGQGSPHYSGTVSTGKFKIQHLTQIHTALLKRPNATQSNNALTTKANAHKNDSSVSETDQYTKTKKLNNEPGEQYVSWKDFDKKITYWDCKNNLKVIRNATISEHRRFSLALRGKSKIIYKKYNFDIKIRFNSGAKKRDKKKIQDIKQPKKTKEQKNKTGKKIDENNNNAKNNKFEE